MSDMADDFRFMKEEARIKRIELTPSRLNYAMGKLMEAGHTVKLDPSDKNVLIVNESIKLYPYKGWFTGKGITDGRGIDNLIKQLAN